MRHSEPSGSDGYYSRTRASSRARYGRSKQEHGDQLAGRGPDLTIYAASETRHNDGANSLGPSTTLGQVDAAV
jgi:hypothetical protein